MEGIRISRKETGILCSGSAHRRKDSKTRWKLPSLGQRSRGKPFPTYQPPSQFRIRVGRLTPFADMYLLSIPTDPYRHKASNYMLS